MIEDHHIFVLFDPLVGPSLVPRPFPESKTLLSHLTYRHQHSRFVCQPKRQDNRGSWVSSGDLSRTRVRVRISVAKRHSLWLYCGPIFCSIVLGRRTLTLYASCIITHYTCHTTISTLAVLVDLCLVYTIHHACILTMQYRAYYILVYVYNIQAIKQCSTTYVLQAVNSVSFFHIISLILSSELVSRS